MKKFIISLVIILGIIFINKDRIIIPEKSIRFRVIASSNSEKDQNIKKEVKNKVEKDLFNIVDNNIDNTRKQIQNNLTIINNDVENVLGNLNYKISYGMNYFPEKEYKGIKYKKGMYESLVITIGNGLGDNWWCVLFPPLCTIEAEENQEIEYKIKVKEILDKYF